MSTVAGARTNVSLNSGRKKRKKEMTNEEAMEIITNALQSDESKYTEKIDKALAVVQKRVLEQQPCVDCISRQAVLDDLEKSHITSGVRNQGTWNECIGSMMRTVKSMPSVTPQPKMGRWEWVQYDANPNIGNWHCSKCNRIVCGAITAVNPVYAYKYCPECGAKMDGEERENNEN